ncbi:MAG: exonuclease domain-containing protein [Acidobacteriota bacterium]
MRGPLAVIDCETTGLFPLRNDRIIEIAAVLTQVDGSVEKEFASLVNPERDIGKSDLHGLVSEDVIRAPRFSELAPALVDFLSGCVAIAGHNVRFDHLFLKSEFSRMGVKLPDCPLLCTMRLAHGGKLVDCCRHYGVRFDGAAHEALTDARATGKLLHCLLRENSDRLRPLHTLSPIPWPPVPGEPCPPVTRSDSRRLKKRPSAYIERLVSSLPRGPHQQEISKGAQLEYRVLLDRVLEDRVIEEWEANALLEMASEWDLHRDEVERIHRAYLRELVVAAWEDGIITEMEQRDLETVARLLGLERDFLGATIQETRKTHPTNVARTFTEASEHDLAGQTVCFTGELRCSFRGSPITKQVAGQLAERAGLIVLKNVTKKLDILVVADPMTQSGKAKKARQYGTRLIHEPVFWRRIGVKIE